MNALNQAIVAKFNAAGLATTITGGIWLDMPPSNSSGVQRPWCVFYNIEGAKSLHDFQLNTIDPCGIQFSVSATGAQLANQLIEQVTAVFDNVELTLTGGAISLMFIRRVPTRSYVDPSARDESGNQVWRANAVYDATIQNA